MEDNEKEKALARMVIERADRAKCKADNWTAHWAEVACFVIPEKNNVYEQFQENNGRKANTRVYEDTAIDSNDTLASALQSMLTNPTLNWFGFTHPDPDIAELDEVKEYFEKCVDIMHNTFNNSNFHDESHQLYLDLPSLGTGFFITEEHDKHDVTFRSRPIFESGIEEDGNGKINAVYRIYKEKWQVVLRKYADKFSDEEKEKYLKVYDQEVDIIHAVYPNDEFVPTAMQLGNNNKPYLSVHVIRSLSRVVKKSGFDDFPFAVPRWSKYSGEVYGRSPAMKALPTIKMINQLEKSNIRAIQKQVDPPVSLEDETHVGGLRTHPGAINYRRRGSAAPESLFLNGNINIGVEKIEQLAMKIKKAFFIDKLELRDGPQMTATEVLQRTDAQLRLMAPILARLHNEFLRPVIDRTFTILLKKKKFPETPKALVGKTFDITYSSAIARAQKVTEAENANRGLQSVGSIIQMDPNVIDNIDTDAMFKKIMNAYSQDHSVFRKGKDVKDLRAARAEQLAKQEEQVDEQLQADNLGKLNG